MFLRGFRGSSSVVEQLRLRHNQDHVGLMSGESEPRDGTVRDWLIGIGNTGLA